jgi:uncharacterized protein (DUF433 family)
MNTTPSPSTAAKQQAHERAARPYFLWDYDLTEADIRAILRSDDDGARVWLASRILESARYEDVWNYLTLAELRTLFPRLQLKPQVRAAWDFALQVWDAAPVYGR